MIVKVCEIKIKLKFRQVVQSQLSQPAYVEVYSIYISKIYMYIDLVKMNESLMPQTMHVL